MMALHVHGEISRTAGPLMKPSQFQEYTSRIHLAFGHMFDAARCAFNSHAHAIIAKQTELAVEAGAIFVKISSGFISDEAENLLTKSWRQNHFLLAKKRHYYK